jgi:hypothetical protein
MYLCCTRSFLNAYKTQSHIHFKQSQLMSITSPQGGDCLEGQLVWWCLLQGCMADAFHLELLILIIHISISLRLPILKQKWCYAVIIPGVQPMRKRGLQRRSLGTFLHDYRDLPRYRECSPSPIPSRQFPYMHTFIRILLKDNTNFPCFITGVESDHFCLHICLASHK